ncbi:MAG: CHAT domain-containing protein [Bacteroidales bacterium]|nr:CHAT domain-containing protein [Bacteroidales bacterium]
MKHSTTIIILTFLLLPLYSYSQSEESNYNYNEGMKLYNEKKYYEAIPFFEKCDSLNKAQLADTAKNYNIGAEQVALCWLDISKNAYKEKKIPEAIKAGTIASEMCRQLQGEENIDYIVSLNNLGLYHHDNGNIPQAINILSHSQELSKKVLGEDSYEYAEALETLASCYCSINNYNQAVKLQSQVPNSYKKKYGEDGDYYIAALINLGTYCRRAGRYAESIQHYITVMNICANKGGSSMAMYLIATRYLAMTYAYTGNYIEAIKLGTIVMQYYKVINNGETEQYADILSNMAVYNNYIGNYNEAIRLETMAMEITKKLFGEHNSSYATSLNNLAAYNRDINKHEKSIELVSSALEIWKETVGEDAPEYITTLSNLFVLKNYTRQYDEAIELGTSVLEKTKKIFGENNRDYANILIQLADSYAGNAKYDEAIKLGKKASEILNKTLGKGNVHYASSLYHIANYYYGEGKYDEAAQYYQEEYSVIKSFIMNSFATMTSKERAMYWNDFNQNNDNNILKCAYTLSQQPSYHNSTILRQSTSSAYNWLLFSKGLLLNTELEIQKVIEQSKDSTLINSYTKLKADRENLDRLYATSLEKRTANVDSLLLEIEKEERTIVESAKGIGDYTQNIAIDWHDVQQKLSKKDIAIEFTKIKDSTRQDIYIALVLSKGMKSPQIVKLFGLDDFGRISKYHYYNTPKLYNLIWKPLEPYLIKAKNIYFAPSSRLLTIGIEYLPDTDSILVAEKYNVYRLSSTRELALEHHPNKNKKAATFGGIRYDEYSDETDIDRGGATYLPGTKTESENVEKILIAANYQTTALSDTMATEESFKKLSGTNLKILHIGTHGFYMDETDMENAGLKFYTSSQQSDEDRALSCSGLLFAGANATLDFHNRNAIAENADDGVLTAKEVSRLNFQGLDLVVLSACQTGLGAITDEGVFGLQRGFKKAGANTIIMSLWEVSDLSTQLLMTEFFKNLASGMTKHDAFATARNTVRSKYPDPTDWAAFIMVDGQQ